MSSRFDRLSLFTTRRRKQVDSWLSRPIDEFFALRPLKSKQVEEVARLFLGIFTLFDVPSREFASQIVEKLKKYWPKLKIVREVWKR